MSSTPEHVRIREHDDDHVYDQVRVTSPAADGGVATAGLGAAFSVLRRRWPIVLVGLLATVLISVGIVKAVPSSYSATGTLVLLIPDAPAQPNSVLASGTKVPANPYLGTRGFVGDLITTIMADPDAEARVVGRGGTGSFKTSVSIGDASLIKVDTTGKTPAEALATWTATADETRAALIRVQKAKDAPDDLLVTADPLTMPLQAQKESGSRSRALIATVVLGLALTVLLTFAVESIALSRRNRRRRGRANRTDDNTTNDNTTNDNGGTNGNGSGRGRRGRTGSDRSGDDNVDTRPDTEVTSDEVIELVDHADRADAVGSPEPVASLEPAVEVGDPFADDELILEDLLEHEPTPAVASEPDRADRTDRTGHTQRRPSVLDARVHRVQLTTSRNGHE